MLYSNWAERHLLLNQVFATISRALSVIFSPMFMIQFSPMSLLRFGVVRSQTRRLGFIIFSTCLNTDKAYCAHIEIVWTLTKPSRQLDLVVSWQRRPLLLVSLEEFWNPVKFKLWWKNRISSWPIKKPDVILFPFSEQNFLVLNSDSGTPGSC